MRPHACACATPVGVSPTSVQPVKRLSRFQVDSPWRIRTSRCISVGGARKSRNFIIAGFAVQVGVCRVSFLLEGWNWVLVLLAIGSGAALLWQSIARGGGGVAVAEAV